MRNKDRPDGGRIAERLREFGRYVAAETPIYGRLCTEIADEQVVHRILAEAPHDQPAANLLFAAVQYLVLEDPSTPLADHYPSVGTPSAPEGDLGATFLSFCRDHEADLASLVATRTVQTNEVRRCVGLLPALVAAAAQVDAPLGLIEIGASAGLTLAFDRYRYEYGSTAVGPADARVVLTTEVRTTLPALDPFPEVQWRLGVDVDPIDLTDADAVRWLRALLWPEQIDRVARFEAAAAVVSADPPEIVPGDGTELLHALLGRMPSHLSPVVVHTFVLNQIDAAGRTRIERTLMTAGRDRPVLRIGIDFDEGQQSAPVIRLHRYDHAGHAERILGVMHHHGEWLEWTA
jgi:hypothetical protein